MFSLCLALVISALVFVGCETTESASTSATLPAPTVDAGMPMETNSAPVEAVMTTPPTDDGSGQIIPLEKLPKKKGYPYAIKTKWPGLVKSPYAQDKQVVDVSSMSSGTPARCPHTGKIFIVP